ncbi:hypothetical protein OH799_28620 [Nocardia sp. NBC_00881]|nr:hypothetical protein OH799_28620 [Nocardia sp. NBC_00881]
MDNGRYVIPSAGDAERLIAMINTEMAIVARTIEDEWVLTEYGLP